MRARVREDFICKYTGRNYSRGDVIAVNQKRFEELGDRYLIEVPLTTKLKFKKHGKIKFK